MQFLPPEHRRQLAAMQSILAAMQSILAAMQSILAAILKLNWLPVIGLLANKVGAHSTGSQSCTNWSLVF